jgi:catechol 2,3-dioxygenase-like lactoylglutathione lyase family enzyme
MERDVSVWYRVRDLAAARAFYRNVLGFDETFTDEEGRWARLQRDDMEIALWEAQGDEGGVASVSVPDLRAEVERLRDQGVEVGVILELHGQVRIVDVFDPDGNRIQLTEEIS